MAVKATIQALSGPNTKPIEVMFNPSAYNVTATGQLTGEGACLQFKKASLEDFTVNLFYDTYEEQSDVRDRIRDIAKLVMPTVEGKATKQPPVCLFAWGDFTYRGVIYKIDQKFTMFLPEGIPVRAELTVTFKSVFTEEDEKNYSGKEACRKLWTVKSGDRLDLIAHAALKDAHLWRKIAELNNIENPMEFPAEKDFGTVIAIPDAGE